jgi:hypothetical protein
MFDINAFKSNVNARGGFQPSNKFRVLFNAPRLMQTQQSVAREMRFWMPKAPIPGVKLKLHSVYRYGYGLIETKPIAPIFTSVVFMINADAEGKNWKFFKDWVSVICDFNLRTGMTTGNMTYEIPYKADYVVDMSMVTYDNDGREIQSIVYREAYPSMIPDINHSWSNKNLFTSFPVEITFVDWYTERPNV